MKRTFIYSFFLILCVALPINAQKTVLATGSNATGSNGSASYSVGQIDYTNKGTNSQIMEGL